MHLVDELLENARSDTDLLLKNDEHGDDFSIPRDIEFLLVAPLEERANLVRDFINDNQYGVATVQSDSADEFGILVVIHLAPQQHVLCSVSALMVCIAKLFDIQYDGWGCVLQPRT